MRPQLNHINVGDCIEVMKTWPANFVDTIITDPPYGLSETRGYNRASPNPTVRKRGGFMGMKWDSGVPGPEFWVEMLRICKPGAMILAFGGTRTFHRLAVAIEDAGWQIRDCLMWLYGSGFPKSLDISKAIDKAAGHWRGKAGDVSSGNGAMSGPNYERTDKGEPVTATATAWRGYGTALKPAWEPIIVAMKPLDGTFAENAEKHGVAGINVDGGRIRTGEMLSIGAGKLGYHKADGSNAGIQNPQGRWPANLILDEEAAPMLGDDSRFFYVAKSASAERNEGCNLLPRPSRQQDGDPANWDLSEGTVREKFTTNPQGNHHPTVKPLSLMKYLCNLTKTPTGGIVLDPFAGSGTTLWAAEYHNRPWIGIEMNAEYVTIANARIARERSQLKMAI